MSDKVLKTYIFAQTLNKNIEYRSCKQNPRPGFSLLECYRQQFGLIFYKKNITVLVFIMGQSPKFPGYNSGKNQGDKLQYIFNVYPFTTISGAGQHTFNTCQ